MVEGNRKAKDMFCLFLYIFISIIKESEGVLECRDTDCVLCDCYNQTQQPQTLTCDSDHIIRLEFFEQRRMRYSFDLRNGCDVIYNDTFSCFKVASQTRPVEKAQKLAIYHKCNAKRTCDVNFPTDRPVKVEVPYVCEPEYDVRRISKRFVQDKVRFPIIHFSGKEFTKGQILNCECRIGIPETVLIEAFFLNLGPEACKKVIISNNDTPLFTCFDNGLEVLYGPEGNIVGDMRIQIRDLVVQGDEVLYFKLRGTYEENMSINCTGCSVRSGPPENPASDSFMYHVILGTVCGILGVVILTIAVCVLYRCRQRKQANKPSEPSEQDGENNNASHYDYIDDDAISPNSTRINSGSHQYLDLISDSSYLEPQVPAAAYMNGYINGYPTTDNGRRDPTAVDRIPLNPRTSTDSSYNRAFISNK